MHSEKKCPLCGTVVFHPEMPKPAGEKPYPEDHPILEEVKPSGVLFVITVLLSLPLLISLLCDLGLNHAVTWSGYVVGSVLLFYVCFVLPYWFKRPNPVIFVPSAFAAIALFLLYINFACHGHWFLTFALPVTGGAMFIVTGVVALIYYLRRGYLYIFGGALILTGGYMVMLEFLINLTFHLEHTFFWSVYPLAACVLLGGMLLVIAINKKLRESLAKKLFL